MGFFDSIGSAFSSVVNSVGSVASAGLSAVTNFVAKPVKAVLSGPIGTIAKNIPGVGGVVNLVETGTDIAIGATGIVNSFNPPSAPRPAPAPAPAPRPASQPTVRTTSYTPSVAPTRVASSTAPTVRTASKIKLHPFEIFKEWIQKYRRK
jgi:hypothetical protein